MNASTKPAPRTPILVLIAIAFAGLAVVAPAFADDDYALEAESPLRIRGLLDTRVVHGSRDLGWTDRGPGKTRYGGNPSGDGPGRDTRLVLSQLALEISGSLPFGLVSRAQIELETDADSSTRPLLIESFVRREWGGAAQGFGFQAGTMNPPLSAHELLARGLALGGELREVTVLFADLRDSTALGERLTPTALLELLNAFLGRMAHAIEHERGIVDKYVGDEIMAVFGAPLDLADHAERASAAAVGMMEALRTLNAERAPAAPLRMGIGIATGTVIAGNVGSSERLNYTVLGDVVNLAARLQALTKEHDVALLMNEATQAGAQKRFTTRGLGTVTVRGRTAPTTLYTIETPTVPPPPRA